MNGMNGLPANGIPPRRVVVSNGNAAQTGAQASTTSLSDRFKQIQIAKKVARRTSTISTPPSRLPTRPYLPNPRGTFRGSSTFPHRGASHFPTHTPTFRGGITKPRGGPFPPFRGGRGRGRGTFSRGFPRRGTRGGFSFRGGRGGGRGGKPLSGDALDKELDQYMSKNENYVASRLDNELDEYMAEKSDGAMDVETQ